MVALSRRTLLIEFGTYAGGGTSGSQPRGLSGMIPNVSTARFASGLFGLNPKKEQLRQEAMVRRRLRLRELIREWLTAQKATIQ